MGAWSLRPWNPRGFLTHLLIHICTLSHVHMQLTHAHTPFPTYTQTSILPLWSLALSLEPGAHGREGSQLSCLGSRDISPSALPLTVPVGQSPGRRRARLSALRGSVLSPALVQLACSVALVVSNSVTPWSAACQAPLSLRFSRQEYWSGLPRPPPENLLDPGIEPVFPVSPALPGRFFTTSTRLGSPTLVQRPSCSLTFWNALPGQRADQVLSVSSLQSPGGWGEGLQPRMAWGGESYLLLAPPDTEPWAAHERGGPHQPLAAGPGQLHQCAQRQGHQQVRQLSRQQAHPPPEGTSCHRAWALGTRGGAASCTERNTGCPAACE